MVINQATYNRVHENFLEADRPVFNNLTVGDAATGHFALPWNYDKAMNSERDYPLIIIICGSGSVGDDKATFFNSEMIPQFWTAKDADYCVSDQWKDGFECFIYCSVPDIYYDATIAADDAATIEYIKSNYRVDANRIYILGYSMGGSGSHYLANAYYAAYGSGIAAISRLVGYLEPNLDDVNIPCWYQVGLDDNSSWITVVETAYDNFKTAHSGGFEKAINDVDDTYAGITKEYWHNNELIGKLSEWTGMNHTEIRDSCYDNPDVLEWIFSKELS